MFDDLLKETIKAFDIVVDNVTKVRGGKPSLVTRYVTTGIYEYPDALETAKRDMISQIESLGLFQHIDILFIGREELIDNWVSSYSGVESALPMQASATLPHIAGVEESYLVVAKASDYVTNLLSSPDGTIRSQIFEENVRHFLGTENPVNTKIKETLGDVDGKTRFPVLNNGVTIVSPDVRVQGNTLHLNNYQIVNGCQTSHVLFENRDGLTDDITLTIKVVETADEDVFSELVRATNSQSKVEETQFLSLSPITKRVEAYFNTFDGQDSRLYFERRDRQYVGRGIPAIRIITLQNVAKCVASMFLRRPDLAYRYPKRMYETLGATIFSDRNKESIFYAGALALYRFHLLASNRTIPQNTKRLKWHILPVVAALIAGKNVPKISSRQIDLYANIIVEKMATYNEETVEIFRDAISKFGDYESITNDRLKRQAVLEEALAQIG